MTFGPSAHGDTPTPLRHADVLNRWSLFLSFALNLDQFKINMESFKTFKKSPIGQTYKFSGIFVLEAGGSLRLFFKINFESFRTFTGALFHKPVKFSRIFLRSTVF